MQSSFQLNNQDDRKLLIGLAIETYQFEFIKNHMSQLDDDSLAGFYD